MLVAGVTVGSTQIGPGDTLGVILYRIFGLDLGSAWTAATETIVWELRLPRVLTAAVVGAGLASPARRSRASSATRSPTRTSSARRRAPRSVPPSAILVPVGLTVFQFGLVNALGVRRRHRRGLLVFRLGGAGRAAA